MRILAIDTALDLCSACVAADAPDEVLAQESMALARGHAEALLPMVERVMARVEGGFEGLTRVAVTVGPGSYTGLRVGLSAARAVGLAAGIPVVGVTTLSALLAPQLAQNGDGLVAAAIDARHGAVYLQAMSARDGIAVAPAHLRLDEAADKLGSGPVTLVGSGAPALVLAPSARGGGLSHRLLREHLAALALAGVARVHLEVDEGNAPALRLYARHGFAKVGERTGYYTQADGSRATALTMRADLS